MKVTITSFAPTKAQTEAGVKCLTPEMTCAVGARYSRNDTGLEEILKLVENMDQDKAVDSIFKMVDYGHASIADMAPIPIFIDGISIWLAYYIWSICPKASGQETSTRYVKFDEAGIISAKTAGIHPEQYEEWHEFIENAIHTYHESTQFWTDVADKHPELVNLPQDTVDLANSNHSGSHKAQLAIDRMKRNFVFDRARYFIPVAAKTNLMLVMPARDWTLLTRILHSHYNREAIQLARKLKSALELVVPRLIKHCDASFDHIDGHEADFQEAIALAQHAFWTKQVDINVNVMKNINLNISNAFIFHTNRYARIGHEAQRTMVSYSINGITMAELRDLNRHRTGYKYCPMVPVGFYTAEYDQMPFDMEDEVHFNRAKYGEILTYRSLEKLRDGDKSSVYWSLLGSQYYFEHGTTLDKLAYEIQLRTGPGTHYKYRDHMLKVYERLLELIPEIKDKIPLGLGEPE